MTRVDKSKDGIIGPELVVKAVGDLAKTHPNSKLESVVIVDPKLVGKVMVMSPSMKMKRPVLVEFAEAKGIETKGLTKAQLIEALEK